MHDINDKFVKPWTSGTGCGLAVSMNLEDREFAHVVQAGCLVRWLTDFGILHNIGQTLFRLVVFGSFAKCAIRNNTWGSTL
eukprot:832805-Amphidinium_carterae.1